MHCVFIMGYSIPMLTIVDVYSPMKRMFSLMYGIVALLFAIQSFAQNRRLQMHAVAFYNLENLFDTCHDEGKNDWEFLPDGYFFIPSISLTGSLPSNALTSSRIRFFVRGETVGFGASFGGV